MADEENLNESIETTETTDTTEPTDNSDVTTEEPQTSDNSEVEDSNEPAEEQDSGVFKTLEEANKGYSELRTKYGQQSNEVGELRKAAEELKQIKDQIAQQEQQTAQQNGFNTYKDYQNYHRIAELEADAYMQHISECEFPEEMVNLINEYKTNPSQELLETIEAEFSTNTVKNVAANLAIAKGQLQAQENAALQQQYYDTAKQYVDTYVQKYESDFLNPDFYNLYAEAFGTFGTNLDTDKFVTLMHAYRDSVLKAHGIEKTIENENKSATDEISALSNNDSSKPDGKEKDLLEMSEQELRDYFRKRRRK